MLNIKVVDSNDNESRHLCLQSVAYIIELGIPFFAYRIASALEMQNLLCFNFGNASFLIARQ